MASGSTIEELGFDSRQGYEMFIFTVSLLALGAH
jgi:hypothetical protein